MSTKRKYIDSHWLVFVGQGVLALLFGWFTIFTGIASAPELVVITSIIILCLGIVELSNLIHRSRQRETWGLSLAIAVLEISAGLTLLLTSGQNLALHLTVIALYTIIRGILEVFVGTKSIDDLTDRAIWTICGMCGTILGFVILNSGRSQATDFIKAFGVYMITFGLCSLIYGIHNHDQRLEYRSERQRLAQKAAQSRKAKKL